MKIAMLNISIGDYICFWSDFYISCEKNFLVDCEKDYYVFTDSEKIEYGENENVHIIYQNDMGWPFNTMKRFSMFNRINDRLLKYEYIFFANANAIFVTPLYSKLIKNQKEIICVEHPGYHLCSNEKKPFERRKESNAYVNLKDGKYYVQGAFYGGKTKAFLKMTNELNSKTEDDLKNNFVAIWHDESFLNRYVANNNDIIQILGWQYLKYEEYYMPYEPIIVLRDKTKYLPSCNDRFKGRRNWYSPLLLIIRNIKWKVMHFLGYIKTESIIDDNGNYINNNIGE